MIKEILWVVVLTFLPLLELRYSIPAGILLGRVELPLGFYLVGFGLPWWIVFIVAVVANIFLGAIAYLLLDKVIHLFLHIKWFNKFYHKTLERAQRKVKKYVDKYGILGIAIFVGIPLPMSGVYTGALGAYALGMSFKQFFKAQAIGVLIAGTIVTILTLGVVAI